MGIPYDPLYSVAFEIVSGSDSPSKAWAQLVQHYRISGFKQRRRLTLAFNSMKVEIGEHPRQILLWVDRMSKDSEHVDRPAHPKDIDVTALSVLTSSYDAELRIVGSSPD